MEAASLESCENSVTVTFQGLVIYIYQQWLMHNRHVCFSMYIKPNLELFVVHHPRKVQFIIIRGKKGMYLLGGIIKDNFVKSGNM